MKQYDAIIIGFGKGGKLLAAELAERNWKVALSLIHLFAGQASTGSANAAG